MGDIYHTFSPSICEVVVCKKLCVTSHPGFLQEFPVEKSEFERTAISPYKYISIYSLKIPKNVL